MRGWEDEKFMIERKKEIKHFRDLRFIRKHLRQQ